MNLRKKLSKEDKTQDKNARSSHATPRKESKNKYYDGSYGSRTNANTLMVREALQNSYETAVKSPANVSIVPSPIEKNESDTSSSPSKSQKEVPVASEFPPLPVVQRQSFFYQATHTPATHEGNWDYSLGAGTGIEFW